MDKSGPVKIYQNCSFCNSPGATHEGGVRTPFGDVSGSFCGKECFDKWALFQAALSAFKTKIKSGAE